MPNMPHLVMLYSVCVWYVHLCVSVQVNVAQRSTFGVFLTLCLLSVCLKQPGVHCVSIKGMQHYSLLLPEPGACWLCIMFLHSLTPVLATSLCR